MFVVCHPMSKDHLRRPHGPPLRPPLRVSRRWRSRLEATCWSVTTPTQTIAELSDALRPMAAARSPARWTCWSAWTPCGARARPRADEPRSRGSLFRPITRIRRLEYAGAGRSGQGRASKCSGIPAGPQGDPDGDGGVRGWLVERTRILQEEWEAHRDACAHRATSPERLNRCRPCQRCSQDDRRQAALAAVQGAHADGTRTTAIDAVGDTLMLGGRERTAPAGVRCWRTAAELFEQAAADGADPRDHQGRPCGVHRDVRSEPPGGRVDHRERERLQQGDRARRRRRHRK